MNDEENKAKELLERQREIERQKELDESRRIEKRDDFASGITKMQSPDKWPDPPTESDDSNEE